jgi:hypothetical protein
MASTTEEKDEFSFGIQLNTVAEDRDYHRKNYGDEIQRPDVIDDICKGLLLQARIDRIVHGHETENGNPATLVVFGFRFHGIDENRRFRQAIITIVFQDEMKRTEADPEVIALWPNGDFTLGETTPIDVEDTIGGEAGGNVGGPQGGGQATLNWERKRSYKKSDRATLTGSIMLDMSVRDYGPNNAVRLTINENATATSGLVTDLRAAVLLRRKNDTDRFLAFVKIKAKGNFFYNTVRGLRDLSGNSPPNDPVIFKPGVQYLRPATLARFMEIKLAEKIDDKDLNAARLDDLAGVLATTVLGTSVTQE